MAVNTLQGLHKAVSGPQATFGVILVAEKLSAGTLVRAAKAADVPKALLSASLDTTAVRREGVRGKLNDMWP